MLSLLLVAVPVGLKLIVDEEMMGCANSHAKPSITDCATISAMSTRKLTMFFVCRCWVFIVFGSQRVSFSASR